MASVNSCNQTRQATRTDESNKDSLLRSLARARDYARKMRVRQKVVDAIRTRASTNRDSEHEKPKDLPALDPELFDIRVDEVELADRVVALIEKYLHQ